MNPPIPQSAQKKNQAKQRSDAAYAAEATGLLLLALLLLAFTVVKYWQVIPWSAR